MSRLLVLCLQALTPRDSRHAMRICDFMKGLEIKVRANTPKHQALNKSNPGWQVWSRHRICSWCLIWYTCRTQIRQNNWWYDFSSFKPLYILTGSHCPVDLASKVGCTMSSQDIAIERRATGMASNIWSGQAATISWIIPSCSLWNRSVIQ